MMADDPSSDGSGQVVRADHKCGGASENKESRRQRTGGMYERRPWYERADGRQTILVILAGRIISVLSAVAALQSA